MADDQRAQEAAFQGVRMAAEARVVVLSLEQLEAAWVEVQAKLAPLPLFGVERAAALGEREALKLAFAKKGVPDPSGYVEGAALRAKYAAMGQAAREKAEREQAS